jgi:4a-hydroxytetrahydrobiopterin dehydratase
MSATKPQKLIGAERDAALSRLSESKWSAVANRDAIETSFQFRDFKSAFGFMAQVALHAEAADHHPEWFNVYNRVHMTLATHECNGLSAKDVTLAQFADAVCANTAGCTKTSVLK